jgi:hypothetical protein
MDQQEIKKTRASIDRVAVRVIAAVIVVTALVFAWTSSNHQSDGSAKDTWIDDSGHVHVLGIELGKSTLRNAETALKSRSDIALYIYPDTHNNAGIRLEAYFPAINDHSKVILVLEASSELLHDIQQKGTVPHLYPNDVVRVNLHPKGTAAAQQLIVNELTLIPSIDITADMLASRFGPASKSTTDTDGFTHYAYPEIGLKATLQDKDATMLHFSNPRK